MRSMNKITIFLLMFGLLVGTASADELFSIKAGYQLLSPEGHFSVNGNGLTGSPIDLGKELGYDDSKNITLEAALQYGSLRLQAGYLPIKFSGRGTLNNTVNFKGKTYSAAAQAASEVNIKLYDVGLTYYLLNFDDLPIRFQLGPEIAVKVADAKFDLDGQDLNSGLPIHESDSATVPIPTVGARLRIGFSDYLGLVGRIGYMSYQGDSFLDGETQLEFSPVPLFGVYGGYRYFDVQVDHSGVNIDARFKGPFIGLFARF